MAEYDLKHQMKMSILVVVVCAEHGALQVKISLKVAQIISIQYAKEVGSFQGEWVVTVSKGKQHVQPSDITTEFIQHM